jgi:hypothetical protein
MFLRQSETWIKDGRAGVVGSISAVVLIKQPNLKIDSKALMLFG